MVQAELLEIKRQKDGILVTVKFDNKKISTLFNKSVTKDLIQHFIDTTALQESEKGTIQELDNKVLTLKTLIGRKLDLSKGEKL